MKLQNVKFLTIYLSLLMLLSACEEVIDIDLNSADPAVVAEGLIQKDSVAWLQLSYTTDYFDNVESEKIEDATVTLTDEKGNKEFLEHKGDGLYVGSSIVGETGNEYTLGFEYFEYNNFASALLLEPTEVYSISFEKSTLGPPGQTDEYYQATLRLKNISQQSEYYMFKFWINQKENKDMYYLINDEYYVKNDTIEYTPFQLQLGLNDHLDVFVYSIDASTYEYYFQLNEIGGGGMMGGSSTPYNPISNFGNDIMGYFTAWSFTEYKTIVE